MTMSSYDLRLRFWEVLALQVSFTSIVVSQVAEAELRNQVDRLSDKCANLDASLQEANDEKEGLRMKLLERQPLHFASDANQPLLQSLQQRIAANKV